MATMGDNGGIVPPSNNAPDLDATHEAALTKILAVMSDDDIGAFSQLCDDAAQEGE